MTKPADSALRMAVEAFLDGVSDNENTYDDISKPWNSLPYNALVHAAR